MELYFLGTGAAVPSKERNVSSLALRFFGRKKRCWLFDCGEGTQHQLLHAPVKLSQMERIFISHLHGDHLFGLPGLLGSRSFQTDSPLTIYGPPGIEAFVKTALTTSQTHLRYPLEVKELKEGLIYEEKGYRVTALSLAHGIPSFGYRIEEEEQPGSLKVDELKKLGLPPGPLYKELKEGKTIQLPDGRKIRGTDFVGSPKPGRTLAILGDTRPTANAVTLARGVDVLVHEATYRADQEERAAVYHHSTSVQAAETAQEAGVGVLILTHISARYGEEEGEELLAEARKIFPNTYLAHDFWSYPILR
mgnify:CR=1 FL=1